ncbi:serine/arginine-rich splicing factor 11-like isoform X1 [Acanthochromis polyacanthus]|uniref:serine/arginine-rich splicing factor 11 isoform X2 n=1 Tax=Acanthochromis polyacanthus TaxID=80966 RepID=UPI000B8FD621|nr:serine/arginine-rich splicing factor 11 isoform X2 [Acanthochromis polyacanthus]XP_051802711.1 serine/arginine-rich splicing factor 11-like isoform X1 [Acanthochromis polyacanthus]
MNSNTHVIQVTNVSPSTTSEQMRTLFGFLGNIEELKLFPPDDSPLPVTSRVCFVKFLESESVGVSQHLTNTVFVDRALIVVPFAEGVIPDESKAMSLLAPANAVAGMMPGGGLLPTPNPLASMGGTPFGGLGAPNMEQMAAMGMPGPNMNPQALSADFLKLMQSMDPKLNPLAAGLNLNPGLKTDASNKEIEEAMKRVREAQSLISAAIEPGNKKDDKRKHSRSRSRSRRRRSRSRSRHRRSKSRSRRRSHSRSRRRSKSPRRRRSHSRDRNRRSRSRDRRKEEKSKKRSKTPPKSYSSARRSRSISRRHRRSRSASRSPRRRLSRSPSLRRHKKEKKKEKEREKERERDRRDDRDRSRDERERSTSKKKKSKDKERERERDRKSDSEKGDVKVTRDYDEEEQGYDSDKEGEEEDDERKSDSDSASSPKGPEDPERAENPKKSKVNGDDHHQEDMEMSD